MCSVQCEPDWTRNAKDIIKGSTKHPEVRHKHRNQFYRVYRKGYGFVAVGCEERGPVQIKKSNTSLTDFPADSGV